MTGNVCQGKIKQGWGRGGAVLGKVAWQGLSGVATSEQRMFGGESILSRGK